MELYVVRHAGTHKRDARRWPDDSRRPLTAEGEKKFRSAAAGLVSIVPAVDVVLSSPYERAWRTAEVLAQLGWPSPKVCEELEPERLPGETLGALEPYTGASAVAVIGHNPHLESFVSYLTAGSVDGLTIAIKKGGVARISVGGTLSPGGGELRWLLAPAILREL